MISRLQKDIYSTKIRIFAWIRKKKNAPNVTHDKCYPVFVLLLNELSEFLNGLEIY